jgi:hypothetical protein
MFVAAFDDRPTTPDYIFPFIHNTTAFCDLNFLTPVKDLAASAKLDLGQSKYKLITIDPATLPQYNHAKQLFDDIYVNYSTNPDFFERPCFHRWFALNAATTSLKYNDYICLLDTDFLIGMSPSDVLSQCLMNADNKEFQLFTDWEFVSTGHSDIPIEAIPYTDIDKNYPKRIAPHLAIMTKSFLYDFCKFILTEYYAPGAKAQLIDYYFEAIGNGRIGGISDMTAIANFSMLNHYDRSFNIKNLEGHEIIGNFYSFLYSKIGETDRWKIFFQPDGQRLQIAGESKKLIGVHFQGSAKTFMPLACESSGADGLISRQICAEHMETLARKESIRAQRESLALANAAQPLIFRIANKLGRRIGRFDTVHR